MNVSLLVSILASASVYAALATAVVLVYRANRVLVFHLAELGVLASYLMVTLSGEAGWSLPASFLAALAVALAVSVLVHVLVDHWGRPFGHFVGTVLTIAVGGILMGLIGMIWSGRTVRMILAEGRTDVFGEPISTNTLVVMGLCCLATVAVHLVVNRSRLGISMRAVANSASLARHRGIQVSRVLLVVWLLSGALGTIAGIGMASLSAVAMEGAVIGVSAIVAAILGGLTSLGGAIIGSILLAFGEQMVIVYVDPRYSQVVPILVLFTILVIRPSGLSGRTESVVRV